MTSEVTYEGVCRAAEGNPRQRVGLLLKAESPGQAQSKRIVYYLPANDVPPCPSAPQGMIGFESATLSGSFPPSWFDGYVMLSSKEEKAVERHFNALKRSAENMGIIEETSGE